MPKVKKMQLKKVKKLSNGKQGERLFGIPLLPGIFFLAFACAGLSALVLTHAQGYEKGADSTQIDLTNSRRAYIGKQKLRTAGCLTDFARYWAKHVADTGTIHHSWGGYYDANGVKHIVHTNDAGLANYINFFCGGTSPWRRAGENVGVTYRDSYSLYRSFVASDGHRVNIDNGSFNWIGVGSYRRSDGKMFMTVIFAECAGSCATSWTRQPASVSKATNPYPCATPHPVLKKGSTGSCVKHLQWYLNYIAGQNVEENGTYGDSTVTGVKNIESFLQMPSPDGVADTNFMNTLHNIYSTMKT